VSLWTVIYAQPPSVFSCAGSSGALGFRRSWSGNTRCQPGESDQLLICALVADLGSSWRIRVNAVAMMEVLSGVFVGSVRSASCDDYDLFVIIIRMKFRWLLDPEVTAKVRRCNKRGACDERVKRVQKKRDVKHLEAFAMLGALAWQATTVIKMILVSWGGDRTGVILF